MNAAGRARRCATAAAAVTVALVACARSHTYPLPAAGQMDEDGVDDGVGQLARASVQLRLGADALTLDEDPPPEADDSWRRGRSPGRATAFAGSVYGLDGGFGGGGYGGFGIGYTTGFGITGPPTTASRDRGEASVVGVVTWRGDAGVAWPPDCAGARVARRGAATVGAVVYLERPATSRDFDSDDRWTINRGALVADRCALWPPVQSVGPLPALVGLENGGPTALRLAANGGRSELVLDPGADWMFPIAEPSMVRVDAGDHAPAWILGLGHEHHTTTDSLGRFALDRVPAGSYDLVVWSPPLVRALTDGRPVWTEPTITHQRVTIGVRGTTRVVLALDPAR